MRRLLSLALALVMCWSMVYTLIPAADVSAVETGTAALEGERYTVDWTIPEIGNANVTGGSPDGEAVVLTGLSYEYLGYVSPKYPDAHATDKVYDDATGDLLSGGLELLDGTKGSNHFLNDPWVGMYGNEANGILIDLGGYYTNLSAVKLNMLSDPELGIFLPSNITIATSADGITFDYVGSPDYMKGNGVESGYYIPTEYASVTYDVHYEPTTTMFSGMYILLVFEHEDGSDGFDRCWTFLSEITVETNGSAVMPDFTGAAAMSTYDKPDGDTYEVNVALNSNYQIIGEVGTGLYGDTGRSELTDGIDSGANAANSGDYVSVAPTDDTAGVQVDLGAVTENITSMIISGWGGGSSTYEKPYDFMVFASTDRETYYEVGLASVRENVSGSVYEMTHAVNGNKAFTARYIVFVLLTGSGTGASMLFDEVMVVTTNVKTEKINVAENGTYKYLLNTSSSSYTDDVWSGSKNGSVPALNTYAKGDLNNGISATGTFLDPAWIGYNYASSNGAYVDIVFDLGEAVPGINNVSFKLLEYTNSSSTTTCSVPTSFTAYYSDTDSSFSATSSVTGAVAENGRLVVNSSATNRQIYYTYTATLNSITAQYIMLRIPKDKKELFIDEVKIVTGNVDPAPEVKEPHEPINYDIMSGIWFDCFTITDLYLEQGAYQADEQTYRRRVENYLAAMETAGINTVMLHARSHGDALYGDYTFDSISPTSKRYTGSNYAISTYDAFEIFIEEAHKIGISVHAWVNPLRIGYAADLATYSDDYEVKQIYNGTFNGETHGDYTGMSSDNLNWLNIGYESIRFHIIDTVMEIVNNYDVDGIVMDDYFYPVGATNSFDSECYALYGNGEELGNWRRNNTNLLVRGLYKRIKDTKPDVLFGISPAGDLTPSYEASYNYSTMYADVKLWSENTWKDSTGKAYKYMDYVSPQMYWAPDNYFASATKYYGRYYKLTGRLVDWCSFDYSQTATNDIDGEAVKLVISLGLYRNFDKDLSEEYKADNVILKQLKFLRDYLLDYPDGYYIPVDSNGERLSLVHGQILYRSHSLFDDLSVNVKEDTSGAGWAISEALTVGRSAAIRSELVEYWQGTLTPKE